MKKICAFSSDSRELYKADIYRAMSFPEGHILHFRYKPKYVDSNLLAKVASLQGACAAIFYTHGNVDGQPGTHVSVREATIGKIEVSPDTDLVHVYFRLGKFCNLRLDSANATEKLPPTLFLSELDCTVVGGNDNWQGRVTALAPHFPPITFINIRNVRQKEHHVALQYSDSNRACHYRIEHGSRYVLSISLGNPLSTGNGVEVNESSGNVSINAIKPLETSAQFDDLEIPLIAKRLQDASYPSLLTFSPKSGSGIMSEYVVNLEVELRSSVAPAIWFGFATVVAVASLGVSQPRSAAATWPSLPVLLLAALLLWSSTSFLYYWFNKK